MYQDFHHLLLPSGLRNPALPAIHVRSEHSDRRMGHRNLPSLRRPMPTSARLLGQEYRRIMFRRPRIHHRQPSLQHPHRLRHSRPAYSNDLEPAPRLARQARIKRRLRPRCLRLLCQYLPHRSPILDQSHGPHLHRLPSDIMDAHRARRRSHLFQPTDHPRSVPGPEIKGLAQWNRSPVYQYWVYELHVLVQGQSALARSGVYEDAVSAIQCSGREQVAWVLG